MITVTTNLYTFAELTSEEQQKVIEKYNDINVDYDHWASFYLGDNFESGEFKEKLEAMGFCNPSFSYSGFGYQNDHFSIGDCSLNVEKFLRYHKAWTKEKRLHQFINFQEFGNCANVDYNGCVDFDCCSYELAYEKNKGNDLVKLTKYLEQIIRGIEREFFNTLRDHYFYLISDDQVKETLITNDYHFNKETLSIN